MIFDRLAPRCEDMSDVRGLPLARRALEVAAAGGHHVLLVGPAGCGKSLLARRFIGLLPPMSADLAEQVRRIQHLTFGREPATIVRPFRAPHHTVSAQGLVGERRGWLARPGEIGLAHGGVLRLDDLPEFSRCCLDTLREPLETGALTLWSRDSTTTLPIDFVVVATMSACPCGYRSHPSRPCTCSPASVERYVERVRLLARHFRIAVDLTVDTATTERGECSAVIRERVTKARAVLVRDDNLGKVAATIAALAGSATLEVRHQDEAALLRSALTAMNM